MSRTGLAKSRFARMHRVLSGYVERKELPGLVALVSRHDDVHVETLGTLSVGDPSPMKRGHRLLDIGVRSNGIDAGLQYGFCLP